MNNNLKATIAAIGFTAFSSANAALVTSYDVYNTQLSGAGGWNHTYDGVITGNDYTGGSGTMNDGVIGTSEQNTHLFYIADNSSIVVNLNESTTLTSLFLYGIENSTNGIPGSITGFNVTVNGITEYFTTDFFGISSNSYDGPHESVNFAGSILSGIVSDSFTLSGFTTDGVYSTYFAISEIEVSSVSAVPVPAAAWLFGSGLLGLAGLARRKKA